QGGLCMRRPLQVLSVLSLTLALAPLASAGEARQALASGWTIQSSAKVAEKGDALSAPGYKAVGWHSAKVPTTVVAALVEDGTYSDPYTGMNLRKIPGTTYKIGERFTLIPT